MVCGRSALVRKAVVCEDVEGIVCVVYTACGQVVWEGRVLANNLKQCIISMLIP